MIFYRRVKEGELQKVHFFEVCTSPLPLLQLDSDYQPATYHKLNALINMDLSCINHWWHKKIFFGKLMGKMHFLGVKI